MVWRVGDFLPEPLRTASTTVQIDMHSGDCPQCAAYVARLETSAEEFRIWEAKLVVRYTGAPAVLVADRYGHIFAVSNAGPAHAFMPPRELEEWVKYLGTLCPE